MITRSIILVALGCAAWLAAPGLSRAQLLSPGALSKAHAELEGDGKCQQCHASGAQVAEPRCLDCHGDIGAQQKQRAGLHGGPFRGERCASCHVEHLGRDVSLVRWPGRDPARFDHKQTGFLLRGAHQKTRCADCHDKKNERGAATFLGLEKKCASCHEDPHEKRFGERCNDCHEETSFKKVELTRFDHGLARFALDGAHTGVACAGCHGTPAKFTKLAFSDCSSCHEDPHPEELAPSCKSCHQTESFRKIVMPRELHPGLSLAAGHREATCESCHDQGTMKAPTQGSACVSCHAPVHEAPFGERCEQCHQSVKWTGLPDGIGLSAHRLTDYPLRGAHGQVECAECHTPELARDVRYRGLRYETCASCHADVHKGTLKQNGDCATCHDLLGFAPSLVDPARHAKLGFALEGSHEAAACGGCHSQTGSPRTSWQRQPAACADCHQNPHGTQFAEELRQGGCATCHSPKGWGLPKVDHSVWPLTGAHASTQCDGCHKPSAADRKLGKGASYRGAPRTCEGCHDDVHGGQFRLLEPVRACDSCHQTEQFALPAFDHAARTRFSLEGKHQEAACKSCHPGVPLAGGEEVTRYRLGFDRCADCHADPHAPARKETR